MKKLLICGMLIGICFSNTQAQFEFAPIGAKWTYTSSLFVPPDTRGPYTIEVVGKEEFQGKLCSRIHMPHHFAGSWVGDPLYMYESNDSVYYWSPFTDSFHLLYDFSAEIGDTIVIGGLLDFEPGEKCPLEHITIIDSISYLPYLDDSLKLWYFHVPGFICFDWYDSPIVENIGSPGFMVPNYGLFEQEIGGLRCYSDSLHDIRFVPYTCDTVYTGILSAKDLRSGESIFSIRPNPVSNIMNLDSDTAWFACTIQIYSVHGQLMMQETGDIPCQVDISGLQAGMYICQLQIDGIRSRGELFVISR